jgi:pimeloyl-ACP methyl ester carboxylesterase
MAAAMFAPLADALAADHTVITYDPRGISHSAVDDLDQDSRPDQRGDDVAAILDAVGAESADVFGSSGGAVTGLALVARHPDRVRTLVAHEPPLLELLPDAAERRAEVDRIVETFHRHGHGAAFAMFMATAGFDLPTDQADHDLPNDPAEHELADGRWFFDHELRPTSRYVPDLAALKAGPTRVVVGIGADSGRLLTYRTSMALAQLLDTAPVEFPGDHGGFLTEPGAFARRLAEVLGGIS